MHSQTNPKERDLILPRVLNSLDLPFNAAIPEPSGNKNTVGTLKLFIDLPLLQILGIDPENMDLGIIRDPAVNQGLVDRLVRVLKSDIFSDNTDLHILLRMPEPFNNQVSPALQILIFPFDIQLL